MVAVSHMLVPFCAVILCAQTLSLLTKQEGHFQAEEQSMEPHL